MYVYHSVFDQYNYPDRTSMSNYCIMKYCLCCDENDESCIYCSSTNIPKYNVY